MMTNIGEMDEDLDEGVVADHLRGTDVNRYPEHNYLTFTNFEKADANWTNLMSRQKTSIEETSPQTSHLSPEPNSISDLASFEYNQRLPSLESSSSASIGRSASGLTSQSLFAWQPFGGATIVHPHSQASSLHSAGGHLFPLVSGSSISGTYGTDFPNLSPSSGAGIAIPSHDKADSQFNPLSYANVSAAIAASGRLRASVSSPTAQDLQPLRMEMGLSGANPLTIATPIPTYAPSAGSSNSQSSTPAHQGFTFTPNGGGSSAASSSVPQQLSTGNLSNQPYDDVPKSMNFKQRSKKESHNRIERKRRDYINSQIVYLSSLLPPELYRDVDGRRNKGSVLRLSVNYIKDLREAVSHMSALKQENTLARQVIPLLRKRIETLERIIQEQACGSHTAVSTASPTAAVGLRSSPSVEALYQSWLVISDTNQRTPNNGSTSSLTPTSRNPNPPRVTSASLSDPHNFFPDMLQGDTESELDSGGSGMRCPSNPTRLVNMKREQTEEDRIAGSAPSRVRMDACRLPPPRQSFTDLSASSSGNRMEDENGTSGSNVRFEHQPNLSYERYHRLMQPTCQPGIFGHNE
ncbi:hypothetical protein CRM22_009980 [Opisthorchis felineus]|uniref:BHLH domain-containing protein n=1 Tax=Opisthorchis felineus TaxID=147828 RepID=A0A4S2LA41_OPIFE|nr:hypothetical protein CRM22_009980 [Opisthorchis felineus]